MMRFKVPILIAAVFCVFFAASCFAEEDILTVAEKSGQVLVKIYPSADWTDATTGQALKPQDSIKTEAKSNAILAFPDKSSYSLKPLTEITIEELSWDQKMRKSIISMNEGELRVIIKKLDTPSEFKVKTPTAICGARGCIYYILSRAIRTRVYVTEGIVELINTASGTSYDVVEGMTATSNADGTVSQPQEPPAEEKAAVTSGYDTGMVAEPYTEPERLEPGAAAADEVAAPEVTQENTASRI